MYQQLMTLIIQDFITILGEEVAIKRALSTGKLSVAHRGTVTSIVGDPAEALASLIKVYEDISGQFAVERIKKILQEKLPGAAKLVLPAEIK